MKKFFKGIFKKTFLYLILPSAGLIIFLLVTKNSFKDVFGFNFGELNLNKVIRSSYTSSEVLASADRLIDQKVKVSGIITYTLKEPNYLKTYYAIDGLPLKVPSSETEDWWSVLNQEKVVEGTLRSQEIENEIFNTRVTLYFLEDPVLHDD